jgi:large subunit ribosomal protein L23
VTLIRTPRMPASFAKFIVPLNMNKLDLRDYLYHAYNVRVVSVRSYIDQQKVTQGKPNAPKMTIKRWFRPRAIKKMTVELESPFVWPEMPTKDELNENWSKDTHDEAKGDNDKYAEQRGRLSDTFVDRDERKSMREQARALLQRKEQWKPADNMGFVVPKK